VVSDWSLVVVDVVGGFGLGWCLERVWLLILVDGW